MANSLDVNEQRAFLPLIKETLIDSGKINPESYTHGEVVAAKFEHERFASIVDPELFYCLFKRVASQYILAVDLGKSLEYGTSSFSWPLPNESNNKEPSSNSLTLHASASIPNDLASFNQAQEQKFQKLPQVEKKKSSEGKMTSVSSGPKAIRLPTVVSQWTDKHRRKRVHVFIQAMSGTEVRDVAGVELGSDNDMCTTLNFSVAWPLDVLESSRIFSHTRFGGHYKDNHCKYIALAKEVDRIVGTNHSIVSMVKVSLPGPDYIFTTDCGHHHCVPIILNKNTAKPTIILMFDLVDSKCIKRAASTVDDDLEVG